MNQVLLRHLLSAQRGRLIIVALSLALWGFLLPVVYEAFGAQIAEVVRSGPLKTVIDMFSRIAGGDLLSLSGMVGALAFTHPIPIALVGVYTLGFPIASVAGERQRGTLEVLLARPIGRRTLYATVLLATLGLVLACVTAIVAGVVLGALVAGVAGQLAPGPLLACWINAVALHAALATVGLAASVAFDRLGTALGLGIGLTIAWYAMEFLGALWPTIAWMRPLSLFHYLQAAEVLAGRIDPGNVAMLVGVGLVAIAAGLAIFPGRDLAAPS